MNPPKAHVSLLERLFTGGPEVASKFNTGHIERLKRDGMVEYCSLPGGVLGVRLTEEGNYCMGGEIDD